MRQLKSAHPELASAVDMQIELVETLRRVQARVPLPSVHPDQGWLDAQQVAGLPAVRFTDIPLDWTDFRLALRQTADILHRHEALSRADHEQILTLSRDGNALAPIVTDWYDATSRPGDGQATARIPDGVPAALDQVLVLSIRPFLARCAEVLMQRSDFSSWQRSHCPLCAWEPDFAVITASGARRLVCGRCLTTWAFASFTCPFCGADDPASISSFATRDGHYRVYGCNACHRYLKAFDARHWTRPMMMAVDSIATLPLDAAAMQRGYVA